MDLLFLEKLEFRISVEQYLVCCTQPSREEVLRQCLKSKGIELIDYGSWIAVPAPSGMMRIEVYSRAFRERAERATAAR